MRTKHIKPNKKPNRQPFQFISCCIILLFFLSFPICFANASDFQADYDTQYAVSPNGPTIVTQNVTLTNKQSNIYPKEYSLVIDSGSIKNVIAYDAKGVITPKITKQDKKTNISIAFNEQVVGIDKKLPFTLRYENNHIAQKLGSVWEIRIPGITEDPTLGEYSVSLQTPSSFPKNAYMTPLPANGTRWTKSQLVEGGINAAYGENQTYIVDVSYNLENESLTQAIEYVAIPPNTDYQSVTIHSISPKPKEMKKDEDGNWIAAFELSGSQKMTATAKLYVKTYIKPPTAAKRPLPDTVTYLSPQQYWESTDQQIQVLAKTYPTARAIYQYVVSALSYNYGDLTTAPVRKGALRALQNPKNSLCTEFTDLFIAIARAAGIPAREVVGFAYTNDSRLRPLLIGSDILHAWPEYYDQELQRWIPIDPTWGHTTGGINYFDTFDFNHIAFVIHGRSSELPYPAGSYREGSIPTKNISVRFAETTKTVSRDEYSTSYLLPSTVLGGTSFIGSIQVENSSGTKADSVSITVDALPFSFHATKSEQDVPPFGVVSIPVSIALPYVFHSTQGTIIVAANAQQSQFTFTVKPAYWMLIVGGIGIACFFWLVWIVFRKK